MHVCTWCAEMKNSIAAKTRRAIASATGQVAIDALKKEIASFSIKCQSTPLGPVFSNIYRACARCLVAGLKTDTKQRAIMKPRFPNGLYNVKYRTCVFFVLSEMRLHCYFRSRQPLHSCFPRSAHLGLFQAWAVHCRRKSRELERSEGVKSLAHDLERINRKCSHWYVSACM